MLLNTIKAPLALNERKLLNIVRKHGVLPRHKIVEHMDVSVQAVGQIVRRLDQYGLLTHHKAVKVGFGQPPKPISINADGAFSIGIKIGRRHTEVLLIDLLGIVRERHSLSYALPVANELLTEIRRHLDRIQMQLTQDHKNLIGICIATPFAMGGWHKLLGLSEAQVNEWNALDITTAIQAMTPCPVKLVKDTTAACVAELLNGQGRSFQNFLYLFVDTFIGGSVVSKGQILESKHGNAGAVASIPMSIHQPSDQLVDHVSLRELEKNPAQTDAWLGWASCALAFTVVSGMAFLDTDAVVIDGAMDGELLKKLIHQTQIELAAFNWEGIWQPKLVQGLIGREAGALGGALMPLHEYFYA